MDNSQIFSQEIGSEIPAQIIEEIAGEVASILARRLDGKEIIRLLQITFLDVREAAELLGVKPKTISTWISQGKIPVRYVNSEPRFLLSELLNWTLPEDDKHARHRLTTSASCKIAANRLAAIRERKE